PRPLFQRPPPGPFGQGGAAPGPPFRAPPVRRGPPVRPRADPSQRPARVRGLPSRSGRNPPRGRLLRAHPGRRPDLRHDPLRGQRAAVVRATAITPEPVAGRAAHGIHRLADDARLVRKDGPTARSSTKTHVRRSSRSGAERPIAPANRQASRTATRAALAVSANTLRSLNVGQGRFTRSGRVERLALTHDGPGHAEYALVSLRLNAEV